MLERGMPRAPGQPARVGDYRRGPLARFGGTADPAAPGQPDVVSVRGHRIRLRGGCGLHVGGGVPSGEGTHRRHPPRGRWGFGVPRDRLTDKKYTPANGHVADVALRWKSASPPNRRGRRHARAPSPGYVLQSWNVLGNIPWADASGAAAAESRRTSR